MESSATQRVTDGREGQGSSGLGLLGVGPEERQPGARVTFPEINQPPTPVFSLSDPSLRTIPPRTSTPQATPSLLEALAQGVCQLQDLQRAAMESKSPTGSEAETVKFAKSELPSLPDVNAEDSSIRFSDRLRLVRSLVEDASLTSAAWWQHILKEANEAYETWQACDPLRRLSIEPQAKESQNPKWIRLNARMSSMVYAVMSPALRADATSRRVTSSTLHLVFRLLLHFQPGGATERATILAKLQNPGAAKTPEEALSSLRRWSDWWNRLTETGMTEPDPSVIVKALLSIVEKPLQSAPEVLFRTQVARSALCIDQRPTLQQALSFHRHLLAEFEQFCLSVGGSQDGPKVRLAQVNQETIQRSRPSCKYYLSTTGCKKGLSCQYKHSMQDLPKEARARKCLRCGSEAHRAKQCPHPGKVDNKDGAGANKGGPVSPTSTSPESSPAKGAAARKAQKQQELQQQQAQASTAAPSGVQEQTIPGVTPVAANAGVQGVGQQVSTASGNAPVQVGTQANPGIYLIQAPATAAATASQQVAGATPTQAHVAAMQASTPTVDPLAITRLLQQIGLNPVDVSAGRVGQDQGPRLNALVVSSRMPAQEETPNGCLKELGQGFTQCRLSEAPSQKPDVLADSGATNVLRGPRSNEEWDKAEPVQVKLAANAETILRQTPVGSLLHPISSENPEPPPIVPLGRIIERLGYVLTWDKDSCILRAPNGTVHKLKVREGCPYLSHSDAGRLILRLEAKAAEEGLKQLHEATVCTATAVSRARESMSRTWYDAMKDYSASGNPEDASRAEFLARWLDYAPPCSVIGAFPRQNQVNAWEMLSRVPGWSRRFRRRLKASKNWVVHLFAGDGTWDPLPITSQRDEVVVTVDVRAGKAQDVMKGSIWDVLIWAARTGRIAHVIGAPPRVSFLPNPSRAIPQNEAYFTDLGMHNPTLRSADEPNQRSIRELSLVARMLILHALATAGREVYRHNRHLASEVGFAMEHPQYTQAPTVSGGSPLHSVWESVLWRRYAEDAMMDVITFTSRGEAGSDEQNQKKGGTISRACEHRDTWTLGTNIPGLILHSHQFPPDDGKRRHHAAKWTPTFKSGLSRAIGSFHGALRLAPMSAAEWSQHQKAGHIPFRRDCAACVSGAAASRAHRKLSHPHVHTLNVDLMGPFKTKGWDATCRKKTEGTLKFALVGCYRFPDPLDPGPPWPEKVTGGEKDEVQEEPCDDKGPDPFECEGKDEGLEEYAPSEKEDEDKEGECEGNEMFEEFPELFEGGEPDEPAHQTARVQSPEWDLKWEGTTKLLHFAVPLSSSKASGAVVAIQQIIAYLRGLNLPVFRLHSDRGREFENSNLKNFLARHAIVQSFGEPGFPQSNGMVESTIRSLKAASRKLLIDSHLPLNAWPQALATAATLQRSSALGLPNKLLTPFGTKVLALQPRSHEKRQEFSSRWVEYRYVGISQLVSGAHVLVKHEGGKAMFMHSTNVRANTEAPPEPPPMHVPLVGRRITGKTKPPSPTDGPAVRQVNKEEALKASFEEEARKVLSDWDPAKARQCVLKWCKKMPGSKFLAGLCRRGGIVGEHTGNKERPLFVRLLNALLTQYAPGHEYTSIGLFTDAPPVHTDRNNHPDSMNVVLPLLMPRSGGHHWTQVMPGDVLTGGIEEMQSDSGRRYYGVVNRLQTLVPSLLNPRRRHGVTAYQGNRVVLVGYRVQTLEKVKVDTWANIENLGFPCEGLLEGLSAEELKQLTERSRGRFLDDVTSPFSRAVNPTSSTLGDQTLEDSGLLGLGGGSRRFQEVSIGAHSHQTEGGRSPELVHAVRSSDRDAGDLILEDSGLQRSGGWTEKVQGASESVELQVNWGLKVSPHREGDAFQNALRAPLPVVPKEMNQMKACLKHHESAGWTSHNCTGTSQDFVPRNVRSLLVPLSGEGYVELVEEESCEATAEVQSLPKSLRTIQAVRKVEQSYTADLETLLESLNSPLKVVHLCDPREAKTQLMKWKPAIQKEFEGIKHGLKRWRRGSSEFRRLLDLPNTIQVPSKIVFSVKPPTQGALTNETLVSRNDPGWAETMFFRRKARIVCCGNYAEETGLPVYASGASSETLRILLIITSKKNWSLATLDIAAAFLQTPMPEKDFPAVIVKPPAILKLLNVIEDDEQWQLSRALYGLREAPRLWGLHRDSLLKNQVIQTSEGEVTLVQCDLDGNLWLVKRVGELTGETLALLLIYVDDLLFGGPPAIIDAVAGMVRRLWDTSPLTYASEDSPIQFLGTDIAVIPNGFFLSQGSYLEEIARTQDLKKGFKTPVSKDDASFGLLPSDPDPTPEDTLRAQQRTGEVLWLSQRSRPDLGFVAALAGSLATRAPVRSERVATRALCYAVETKSLGLRYQASEEQLQAYTDASFAPDGAKSHTGWCLYLHSGALQWKSSRQPFVVLSSAEAELLALQEGAVALESISALIAAMGFEVQRKQIFCDSTSAICIQQGQFSWRTRHLRIRCAWLSEKLAEEEFELEFQRGNQQRADLLTKALSRPRIQDLSDQWGLFNQELFAVGVDPKPHTRRILLALMLLLQSGVVTGQEEEEESERGDVKSDVVLYLVAGMLVITAVALWEVGKVVWRKFGEPLLKRQARKAQRNQRLRNAISSELQARIDDVLESALTDQPMQAPPGSEGFRRRRGLSSTDSEQPAAAYQSSLLARPPTSVSASRVQSVSHVSPFEVPTGSRRQAVRIHKEVSTQTEPQVAQESFQPRSESRIVRETVPALPARVHVGSGECYHLQEGCQGYLKASNHRSLRLCEYCRRANSP